MERAETFVLDAISHVTMNARQRTILCRLLSKMGQETALLGFVCSSALYIGYHILTTKR